MNRAVSPEKRTTSNCESTMRNAGANRATARATRRSRSPLGGPARRVGEMPSTCRDSEKAEMLASVSRRVYSRHRLLNGVNRRDCPLMLSASPSSNVRPGNSA